MGGVSEGGEGFMAAICIVQKECEDSDLRPPTTHKLHASHSTMKQLHSFWFISDATLFSMSSLTCGGKRDLSPALVFIICLCLGTEK